MALKLTFIARLSDGLPLAASMEDDKDTALSQYVNQRKQILKELSLSHVSQQASRQQIGGIGGGGRAAGGFHAAPMSHGTPPLPSGASATAGPSASAASTASHVEKMTVETGGPFNFHVVIDTVPTGICYMVLCEKQFSSQLAYSFLEDLRKEFSQLHGREVDSVERPYAFMKFDTFIQKSIRVYSDTRTKRNIEKLKEELTDVQQIVRRNIEDIIGRKEKLSSMMDASQDLLVGTHGLKAGATRLNRMYFWRTYGPIIAIVGIIVLVLLLRWLLF